MLPVSAKTSHFILFHSLLEFSSKRSNRNCSAFNFGVCVWLPLWNFFEFFPDLFFVSIFAGSSWFHAVGFFDYNNVYHIKKITENKKCRRFSFVSKFFSLAKIRIGRKHIAKTFAFSWSKCMCSTLRVLIQSNESWRQEKKIWKNIMCFQNCIDFVSWIQICTLNKLVVNVNIDNKWLKW